MATNVDIMVYNQMMGMYSENENAYVETCINDMFEEVDVDSDN